MHQQAKVIIKDCAGRNKRQEPGYESVTESMKRRLKELVGDYYWMKANEYLIQFIEQKRRQHAVSEPEETEKKNDGSGKKPRTMATRKRMKGETAVANETQSNDVLTINAGGKLITAMRSTLTIPNDSMWAYMFS